MDGVEIPELVQSLGSKDEGPRKKAAFRLQSLIGDPSFADTFISSGGLPTLQYLAINASGNTLAYTLACCTNLLDLDQGWEMITPELIERLVQLIVAHPLVNILRGAMSILAFAVSHPPSASHPQSFGSRALQPSLDTHPNFLEMLVSRLSSADHSLCANALQLINALMRDAMAHEPDTEWPKFIHRLQDLGVIKAVYILMQSSSLADLAQPLLDFQSLTKVLLRKWRDLPISTDKIEHRRALRALYLAGSEERRHNKDADVRPDSSGGEPRHWRRLGFATENPAPEFVEVGFLGMMDLTDFTRKSEDGFRNILLEQAPVTLEQRCPVAKASLAVTSILFDHFEVDRADVEEQARYGGLDAARSNYDKTFKPLLLQWSRLHTSGLEAFFRLWATTGAELADFNKIEELVRILVEHVVGLAARTVDIQEVEQQIANYELRKLRELQMELLELTHEDAWGQHLRQIKDDLKHEALQFIREQRIRCLLQGTWFPNLTPVTASSPPYAARTPSWRFSRLSHNRRFLHYSDFDLRPAKDAPDPSVDTLEHRIDLSGVTSVVSNMPPTEFDELVDEAASDTASQRPAPTRASSFRPSSGPKVQPHISTNAVPSANQTLVYSSPVPITTQSSAHRQSLKPKTTNVAITIHGFASAKSTVGIGASTDVQGRPAHNRNPSSQGMLSRPRKEKGGERKDPSEPELPLLTLHPQTTAAASEWLDGLLLLLNQTPITAETNKLVSFIAKYGLRIRLLNVRFEEGGIGSAEEMGDGAAYGYGYGGYAYGGGANTEVVMPTREGVDEDFFYDIGGV